MGTPQGPPCWFSLLNGEASLEAEMNALLVRETADLDQQMSSRLRTEWLDEDLPFESPEMASGGFLPRLRDDDDYLG